MKACLKVKMGRSIIALVTWVEKSHKAKCLSFRVFSRKDTHSSGGEGGGCSQRLGSSKAKNEIVIGIC